MHVTGKFLFYSKAVDSTMLIALSALLFKQSSPTKKAMNKFLQLLNCASSKQDSVLTYLASDMVLAIHGDASYLNKTRLRSRVGGHFFLSRETDFPEENG